MISDTYHLIPIVILLAAIIPLVLFEYRYARFSPWRSTTLGRNFMSQKLLMTALLGFLVASLFFPEWRGLSRDVIRYGLYGLLVVTFWRDYVQLVKAQREGRRKR